MRRRTAVLLAAMTLAAGATLGLVVANLNPSAGGSGAGSSPSPSAPATAVSPTPAVTPQPTPQPTPTAVPTPTPVPLVAAPLTGRMVTAAVARQHPIAVMIDDHFDARPQSGLNAASVVWHAPAEGGIPRYMAIFQDQMPASVGPVRSARSYYIAWAAEWKAMYVHAGGSPQAMATLRSQGRGQLVFNADEFRWGGVYLWRTKRARPHNVYSDASHLRQLADRIGADDAPLKPVWLFAADAPLSRRPVGGRIEVAYQYNAIRYDYDRRSNTYLRRATGDSPQIDQADKRRVAPKNVVVMLVHFAPLGAGQKGRLEGDVIGKGTAWISTNGRTIKGTWRKPSLTQPTRFYDPAGRLVTLTVGQTFVQVMKTGTKVTIVEGKAPPRVDGPQAG